MRGASVLNKIDGCTHVIFVVNPSSKPILLRIDFFIAAIAFLLPLAPASPVSVASIQHLPRDQKLKQVLSDLKFYVIKLDAFLK